MKTSRFSLIIALWCTVMSSCFILGNGNYNKIQLEMCKCPKNLNTPRPFYELFPGFGYYKLNNEAKTWHDAKAICEKEGAHLAILNSQEEVKILQTLRRRLPRSNPNPNYADDLIHIGITDEAKEGDWRTIFNVSLGDTGYSEWDNEQPNLGRRENCGSIYTETGKLHDLGCKEEYYFFCEKEVLDC